VGLIHEIKPLKDIFAEMVEGAGAVLKGLAARA
jgi:hypothetical protein